MDTISVELRSENMRRIRSRGTKPEIVVRRLVHRMGYRYRLHVPDLPGKPDIVLRKLSKIIDVRGCFWHQHGKCIDSHIPKSRLEYWEPKLKKNQIRDAANLKKWKALGFRVLILWECAVQDEDDLARRLARFLTG